MEIIGPTNYSSITSNDTLNNEQNVYNNIVDAKSSKESLMKVAKEFESIFISKMFSLMDKTVDREGGILGEETTYCDKLKSYMFNEMGRSMANNPHSSFGFAKQIYEQMEHMVD